MFSCRWWKMKNFRDIDDFCSSVNLVTPGRTTWWGRFCDLESHFPKMPVSTTSTIHHNLRFSKSESILHTPKDKLWLRTYDAHWRSRMHLQGFVSYQRGSMGIIIRKAPLENALQNSINGWKMTCALDTQ